VLVDWELEPTARRAAAGCSEEALLQQARGAARAAAAAAASSRVPVCGRVLVCVGLMPFSRSLHVARRRTAAGGRTLLQSLCCMRRRTGLQRKGGARGWLRGVVQSMVDPRISIRKTGSGVEFGIMSYWAGSIRSESESPAFRAVRTKRGGQRNQRGEDRFESTRRRRWWMRMCETIPCAGCLSAYVDRSRGCGSSLAR
jgi:hypothetical protein